MISNPRIPLFVRQFVWGLGSMFFLVGLFTWGAFTDDLGRQVDIAINIALLISGGLIGITVGTKARRRARLAARERPLPRQTLSARS